MSPPPHIPGAFPDRSKLLSVDGSGCTRDRTARSAGPSPEPQDVRSDRAAHHRKPGQQIGMIAVDETVEYSAPVGQLVEDIEMKDAKRNSSSARTADEPQDVGKKGDRTIGELIEMLSMETADTWSSSDKLCEEVEKKGVENIFAPDFSVFEAQRPENKKSQTSCYDFVGVTASPAKSMSDLPATGPKQTCNFMQQLSVPQPSQDSPVPEPLPVKKEVARKAHSPDSSGVHTQRPQTSSPAFMPMDIFKDDFSPSPPSTTCPEERYNPQQWHELYATLPPPRPAEQGMSALHGYTSTELNATNLGAANSRGMDDGHLDTAMHGYGIPSSTLQQLYAPFNPIHHQRQPQFGNPNDGSKTEVEKEAETKTEYRFDPIFDIKSLPLAPAQDRLRQASQGTEEKASCYLPVPRHEQGTPPVPATQSPHNGFCPKSAAELIRERSRKKKALPIANKRSPEPTKIHPIVQEYYDIIGQDMHPNDHYASEPNAMSKDQIMQQHEIEHQELLEPSRRALNKRQRVDSDEKINPSAPQAAKSNVLPASLQQAMDDKNKGVSKPRGRVPTQQQLCQMQEQLVMQQRAIREDNQHIYPVFPASPQVGPFYAAESNFLPAPSQRAIDNMNKGLSKPPGRVPTQQQCVQMAQQRILQQRSILQNNPQIYGQFPASPWEPSGAAESEAAASIKEKEEASKKEKAKAKVECATAAAQKPQKNELNRPLDKPEQMDWEAKTWTFYKSGPPFDLAFSSEERDKQLTRFLDFSVDDSDGDFEDEEEDAVTRMRAQVAQTVQARVSFDDFPSDGGYTLPKVPLNDDDAGDETSFDEAEILYGEDVDVEMKDLDDREDEEGEWMLV
ncbi:hypothetical protein D6C87_04258 [Aureobasidium pullulans]|uniref:Uncharacterized protein n=1 Tax=Aureobasidium pullulans TaxID=5580 RepID=A0AB38LVY0_AURPU|nr:hypothetical protein D6C94_05656 [Aureobasidium pullulans]THZ43514.1 hypothetical protein D6C87_04258 [Aureobasidium pullulans]